MISLLKVLICLAFSNFIKKYKTFPTRTTIDWLHTSLSKHSPATNYILRYIPSEESHQDNTVKDNESGSPTIYFLLLRATY